MAYDDLLQEVNGKPFLWRMFIIFFLNAIPNAIAPMSLVMAFFHPKQFRCSLSDTVEIFLRKNQSAINSSLEYFIPYDVNTQEYSKCTMYQRGNDDNDVFFTNHSYLTGNGSTKHLPVTSCAGNYNFGDLQPDFSASIEFNFLCENSWVKPLIMMLYFVGKFTTVIAGILSDRFGRRPLFILCTFGIFLTLFLQSLASRTWFLAAAIFLNGCCATSTFIIGFVLGCEYTIPKHRNFISIASYLGYSFGYGVASLVAYLTPNWRWLLRVNAMIGFLYLMNIWLIPESPRWLMAKGRTEEAKKVFAYIAKCNKLPKPSKKFLEEIEKESQLLTQESLELNDKRKLQSPCKMFVGILRIPRLLAIIAVLCYSWFTVSMIYYGISLNIENLAGNLYLNNTLMGLVEIPGLVLAYLAVKYFSRPLAHGVTAILCSVFCLGAALLDQVHPVASLVAGFIGKSLISGSYYFVYIHTTEILPTVVRNSLLSVISIMGRVGSLISPYFAYIGSLYGEFVPFLVMSILTASSGVATLLLTPETKNVELPEDIEDVLRMNSLLSCCKKDPSAKKRKPPANELAERL